MYVSDQLTVSPARSYPVTVTVHVYGTLPVQLTDVAVVNLLTVSVRVETEVPLFESVTVRVTVKGDPVTEVGVQLIEAELALVHPGGRFVHA